MLNEMLNERALCCLLRFTHAREDEASNGVKVSAMRKRTSTGVIRRPASLGCQSEPSCWEAGQGSD